MTSTAPLRSLPGRLAATAVLAVAFGAPAQAQEVVYQDLRPVRLFIGGGLTAGGDRLATAQYYHGSDYSLRAGGLVQFHGGIEFQVAPLASVALSVGYHIDAIDDFWGSTRFTRVPVELLGHFRVHPNWRLGGGIRWAIDPKLTSKGYAPVADEDFDSSVGPVIEAEYLFNPSLGLKVRGVFEQYRSKAGLPSVNGNHIGVVLNFYF
ncbi:MAG: hypothetical protein GX652_04215 [Burkholderiaceae bacterium]|nr:hypothetical protein [Burkholderiaceae bacterium]